MSTATDFSKLTIEQLKQKRIALMAITVAAHKNADVTRELIKEAEADLETIDIAIKQSSDQSGVGSLQAYSDH